MCTLPNRLKQNPRLIQREMSDGRASLVLEYYLGRSESPVYDADGNHAVYESGAMKGKLKYKVHHLRKKEALSLYISVHPRSALRAALRLIKARNFAVCEIVAKFAGDGIPQHTA